MVAKTVDFDRLLQDLGQFGRFQILLYTLLMIMEIPGGMHHLGQVFLAGSMDHWCVDNLANNQTEHQNVTLGSCSYIDEVSNVSLSCTKFDYDRSKAYTSTLVSEFDLVCSRSWMQAMSQTVYMLGVLWGVVLFGALSDAYGRHKILMLTIVLVAITGTATAFMPTYWTFVFARMLVGACAGGNMTTLFVMVMEAMGKKARVYCGVAVQTFFGLGTMLSALIAYYITDFRYMQLLISLIYVIFLSYYWLIPESLRWQLSRGEECTKTMKIMAKLNGRRCPDNLDAYMVHDVNSDASKESIDISAKKSTTAFDLYKTPNLRKKTLNIEFNWFVNSLVYYGISLLATDLAGNVYINTFFSGLAEFLGCLVFGPVVQKFGRRFTLSFCLILCGVLCLCAVPIPEHMAVFRTAVSMVGKFFIAASFGVVYVYSAELFPTVVRNVGVGSGSMCARIGGLISPFVALSNMVWKPLPFFIFGGLALVAGLLTLLLPETLNRRLPDTIEEGEAFGKNESLPCMTLFRRKGTEYQPDGPHETNL